jgi:hypothetical protein
MMNTLLLILPLIVALVALGVLAVRFGADTRDGHDWRPRVDPPGHHS